MHARLLRPASLLAGCALLAAGCATASPVGTAATGGRDPIAVAASVSSWGSVLAQLGGSRVHERSIISNPDTDPHDYEPTPADARTIADARVFVTNGAGYDSWADKTVAASPDPARQELEVSALAGAGRGANPHLWYDPAVVSLMADRITAALVTVDPTDADYFQSRRRAFEQSALAGYHQLIAAIQARYADTPVGASESVFAPLAGALGLNLITPANFLRAISEGSEPSTADKATIDRQLTEHRIKVYVYNSQNATPDVAAQLAAARRAGIPIATVTETLTPRGALFQDWQSQQLTALRDALAAGTGR